MSRTLGALTLCIALLAPTLALAADDEDPFAEVLFAPELVMEHQSAIGLSRAQRKALITEITQAQADFVPLQMDIAAKAEDLMRLLDAPRIDEGDALAVTGDIMALEGRIKQRHLMLAIRIKNLLSEEQQAELARLRGPV